MSKVKAEIKVSGISKALEGLGIALSCMGDIATALSRLTYWDELSKARRILKQRRILLVKQYTLGLTWLEGQRLKGL